MLHTKQFSSSEESFSSEQKSINSYATTMTHNSINNNDESTNNTNTDYAANLKNSTGPYVSQYQPRNVSLLRFTKLDFESSKLNQTPEKQTNTDDFIFEAPTQTPVKLMEPTKKSINEIGRNNSVYEPSEHASSFSFDNTVDLQVRKLPSKATMKCLNPSVDIISSCSPVKPLNLPMKQTALRISYSTKEFNHNKFIGAGANISEELFSPLDNDKDIDGVPKVLLQHLDLIRDTRSLINNNTFNAMTDSRESSPEKYIPVMQPIIEEKSNKIQRRVSTNPFEAKVLQMEKSKSQLAAKNNNKKAEDINKTNDLSRNSLTAKSLSLPQQLKKKLSFIDIKHKESLDNIRSVTATSNDDDSNNTKQNDNACNKATKKPTFVVLGVSPHDSVLSNSLPAILGVSENTDALKKQKTGDVIVVNGFGNEVDDEIPDYNPFRRRNINPIASRNIKSTIIQNHITALNPAIPARSPLRPSLEKFDTPITNSYSRMDLDVTPKSKVALSPNLNSKNAMFISVAADSPVGYKQIEKSLQAGNITTSITTFPNSEATTNSVSQSSTINSNSTDGTKISSTISAKTIQENAKKIINSENYDHKSVETSAVSALRHTNSIQEEYSELVNISSPYSRNSVDDILEIAKKYLSAPTSPEIYDVQQNRIDTLCSTMNQDYKEEYNEQARCKSFRSSSSNYSRSVSTATPEKCIMGSPTMNGNLSQITDTPKSIQSLTSDFTILVNGDAEDLPQTELISEQDLHLIEKSITNDYYFRKKEARKLKLQEFGFNDSEDKSNHRMSYSLLYGAAFKDSQTTITQLPSDDSKKSRIVSQDYSVLLKNSDRPVKRIVTQKYNYLRFGKSERLNSVEENVDSPISDSPRLRALQFESSDFASSNCGSPAVNLKHFRFNITSIRT